MLKIATTRRKWAPVAWLIAALATWLSQPSFASGYIQELVVTASFAGRDSVAPDEPFELRLNRAVPASEGRVAVIIGATDLTNLFTLVGNGLKYGPQILPLPAGETEVVVYL